MNARPLVIAILLGLVGACGNQKQKAEDQRRAAIADLVVHLRHTFSGDPEKIAAGYGETIRLAEGHRFLHPEFGLVDADAPRGASQPLDVGRQRYVAAIAELLGSARLPSKQEIDKFLAPAVFKAAHAETEGGEKAFDPPSPVDSADGKLHFETLQGDIFVRLFSRADNPNFTVYQMRKSADRWLVVGEFTE